MAQANQQGVAFAKTTRPVIGSTVRREALFAQLDGTPARTVAWISGPAGSGKTTLAASYVEARRGACLWYQVDADDADVAAFFHYLTRARRRLDASRGGEFPAYTTRDAGSIATFARHYFRQFFAGARRPAILVLDNLHEVPADSALHAALEAGITQIPAGCCVIVASRAGPPASLARLRVAGSMVCVGPDELRLSPAEMSGIASLRGQPVSPDALNKLAERTQGWAAALVLMLEHARMSGGIADLPGNATPGAIFEYLAGEIFERFEPRTRRFLLRISSLPRMSSEVAAALAEEPDARRLLANLANNDWFVREVPGEEGLLYQLHPLLVEFLRARGGSLAPYEGYTVRIERAVALLKHTRHIEDAVALLALVQDWPQIASIVLAEADTMLAQGRSQTLASWLELLPAALVESDPGLLQVRAAGFMPTSPRAARRLYARAYDAFESRGDGRHALECCCGVMDAIIREFDDVAGLDDWIGRLARHAGGDAHRFGEAAAATLARALLLRDPGNESLDELLATVERRARSIDEPVGRRAALRETAVLRAGLALLQGDGTSATTALSGMDGGDPGFRLDPLLCSLAALAEVLAGSCASALQKVRAATAATGSDAQEPLLPWLRTAALLASDGEVCLDGAESDLDGLAGAAGTECRGWRAVAGCLRALLRGRSADDPDFGRTARAAVAMAVDLGMPWLEAAARIVCAQALAAESDRRGAEAQLRSAAALAQQTRSPLLRASVQAVAAALSARTHDAGAPRDLLHEALGLARESGLRQFPLVRPSLLAEVCAAALRRGIEPDLVRSLVRSCRLSPPDSAARLRQWPRSFEVALLGGFRLSRDGQPVEFTGKAPGRPLELLKVLLALGGRSVRADRIADTLWPQVDADYAHKSFTAALHRLRRLLDADDALLLREGRLSLNARHCWVDLWALEGLLGEIDELLRSPASPAGDADLRALVDELPALYRGPFLPDESDHGAFLACREQVRARLLRSIGRLARRWDGTDESAAIVDCYLRCIDADELYEPFYRGLMIAHQRRGEHLEGLSAYERLRAALSARMKTMPSPETQAIYTALLARSMEPSRGTASGAAPP